ncbi:O-antigen ligase family protein [Cohnella sp. 56]|uniref:O-antigen ligase family protein n=1 Tax=Cohnella sp. 56 TaxID=3113722 RepID=UPI0030EABB60
MAKLANVRGIDAGVVVLFLFLTAGPFLHGLMFESELAVAAIVILLGFVVVLFRGGLPRGWVACLLLGLLVMYAAAIGYAYDRYESLVSLLKIAPLIPLYVFARAASPAVMTRIWTVWVWLVGLSVPIGIAADRFVEGRLAGFIDYANGYAILLLTAALIAYGLSVSAGGGSRFMQIPIFLCAGGLYLTESRTVLALLLLSFAALFFLGDRERRRLWLQSCLTAAIGLATGALYAWSPLLCLIGIAVLSVLLYRLPDSALSRAVVRLPLLGTAVLLAVAAIGAGAGMAHRWGTLLSPTGEGATRLVYYRDAWLMIMDSPLWGFGAGAWTYMQYHYQTSTYYTAFIHSQPLQTMTETGLLGLLLFSAICIALVASCISAARRKDGEGARFAAVRAVACCALLIHSLADFTLSFPYLLGLLIVLGAVGTPAGREPVAPTRAAPGRSAPHVVARSLAALAAAGLLVLAVLLLISDRLEQSALRAIAEQRKADAVKQLDRSAQTILFSDRIHDRKARLYLSEFEQGGDRRYLEVAQAENEKALAQHPEQIWYQKLRSDILWEGGDRQTSLDILRDLVARNRFMIRWREELSDRTAMK